MHQFDICAEQFDWSRDDRLCRLQMALTGKAAQLLLQYRNASEKEIRRVLKKHFGMYDQTEINQANFRLRRRKPGESIQDLQVDLARLGAKAYPKGVDSSIYTDILKSRFLEALNDDSLHMEVWRCKPKNISEAASFAAEIESHMKHLSITGQLPTVVHVEDSETAVLLPDRPKLKAVSCNDSKDSEMCSLEIGALKKALTELTKVCTNQVELVRKSMISSASDSASIQMASHEAKDTTLVHNKSDLSSRKKYVKRPQGRTRESDGCNKCGELGHWYADCPKLSVEEKATYFAKRAEREKKKSDAELTVTKGPVVNTTDCQDGQQRYGSDGLGYFHLLIGGKQYQVLGDSGCTVSCMGSRFVPKGAIVEPYTDTFRAANKTPIEVVGKLELKYQLETGGKVYCQRVVVSPDIDEIIFGRDWMRSVKCTWDHYADVATVDGQTIKVHPLGVAPTVRRIYANGHIVIPPHHEVDVPVKIPINHMDDRAPSLATEPRVIADGVLTVKGAIPGYLHDGYLKLLNLSDSSKTIEVGTFLTEGIPCVSGETATALAKLSRVANVSNSFDLERDQFDQSSTESGFSLVENQQINNCETDSSSTKICAIVSDNVLQSQDSTTEDISVVVDVSCGYGNFDSSVVKTNNNSSNYFTGGLNLNSFISSPGDAAFCDRVSVLRDSRETEGSVNGCQDSISWPSSQRTARVRFKGEHEYLFPILDCLPSGLTEDQVNQICDMLLKREAVFSKHRFDLGCTDLVEVNIPTGDASPHMENLRSHPRMFLDIIDREIELLRQADVIEPAQSSWNSNILCVKKKDGDVRVVVDLRGVNKKHAPFIDRYPLPRISDCLDTLAGKSWFSSMDVSQSFHQVPVDAKDRHKLAFSTRGGQWQYKRLPMGYSSSPAIYCRLAERILSGLLYTVAIAYIDDTIIMANSFEEMLANLDLVLERFEKAKLKLKPSKCIFFQSEIEFCGHVVSAEGRRICPKRAACLDALTFPKNLHELRSVLGFFSYNRSYIRNFAELAEPLVAMTRKDAVVEPNADRLKAFEALKSAMQSAPVLALARDEGDFELHTDASLNALGAALLQWQDGQLRVVEMASRTLSKCERNYCTTRREALAVIFGLHTFFKYLYGRKFVVRCDNSALSHYKSTPNPMGQVARHLAFMEEFDMKIEYLKGSHNVVADTLSRLPPCSRGPGGEPCRQCHRRMIGRCDPDNGISSKVVVADCSSVNQLTCDVNFEPGEFNVDNDELSFNDVVTSVIDDPPDNAVLNQRHDGVDLLVIHNNVSTAVDPTEAGTMGGPRRSGRQAVPVKLDPDFDYAGGRRRQGRQKDVQIPVGQESPLSGYIQERSDGTRSRGHEADCTEFSGMQTAVLNDLTLGNGSLLTDIHGTEVDSRVHEGLAVSDHVTNCSLDGDPGTRLLSTSPQRVSRRRRIVSELSKHAPAAAAGHADSWTHEFLAEEQEADCDIAPVRAMIMKDEPKPSWDSVRHLSPALKALYQQYESLVVRDGVLYRVFYDQTGAVNWYQLVLPRSLRMSLLDLIHGDQAGHLKFGKCVPLVQRQAWWHSWRRDLQLFVQCCDKCESYHRGKAPKHAYMKPILHGSPRERWSLDLVGKLPKDKHGYEWLFTATDCFSRYAILVPLRNKEAETVSKCIVEHIFLKHGVADLQSDLGTEFQNQILDAIVKVTGVDKFRTTAFRPSCNGKVERLNGTIGSMLAKAVCETQRDWSEHVSYIAFCYNACVHSSTGLSPFFLMTGQVPRWNVDVILQNPKDELSYDSLPKYARDVVDRLETAYELVRNNLGIAAVRNSRWYDKRVREHEFTVGDRVRVHIPRHVKGRTPKLQLFYKDVGVIVKRLNDATYLVSCKSWRSDRVVHADKLKLVKLFDSVSMSDQNSGQVITDNSKVDDDFQVSRNCGIKCIRFSHDTLDVNLVVVPCVQENRDRSVRRCEGPENLPFAMRYCCPDGDCQFLGYDRLQVIDHLLADHHYRPAEVKKLLISRVCDREARQLFEQQQRQFQQPPMCDRKERQFGQLRQLQQSFQYGQRQQLQQCEQQQSLQCGQQQQSQQCGHQQQIQYSPVADAVLALYFSYPALIPVAVADIIAATATFDDRKTIWLMAATAAAASQSVKREAETNINAVPVAEIHSVGGRDNNVAIMDSGPLTGDAEMELGIGFSSTMEPPAGESFSLDTIDPLLDWLNESPRTISGVEVPSLFVPEMLMAGDEPSGFDKSSEAGKRTEQELIQKIEQRKAKDREYRRRRRAEEKRDRDGH
jgi:transposase InsO family protein